MGQSKTLLDFQDDWVKLVDKGFTDYDSLTRDERVWFNVQSIIGDVDNGGLISHYYNSGAEKNYDTIEDLIFLGGGDIAELLVEINKLFPGGRPSKDIDERNNIISSWPDGQHDKLLEELDGKFIEHEADLEQRLIEHILKTGLSK